MTTRQAVGYNSKLRLSGQRRKHIDESVVRAKGKVVLVVPMLRSGLCKIKCIPQAKYSRTRFLCLIEQEKVLCPVTSNCIGLSRYIAIANLSIIAAFC